MIPKIIHYCWLSGDPYPEKIQHCLESWQKQIPDYKFILWDYDECVEEGLLSDWVLDAYSVKKYAFAADYIRLYAVWKYGGIYLDSDVEVLKPFDDLLALPYFIGREALGDRVEIAAFGAEPQSEWVRRCLDYYEGRSFIREDGSFDTRVMPDIIHEVLSGNYKISNISSLEEFSNDKRVFNQFPNDWFCANVHLNPSDTTPTYIISGNTYCVHHFANSWLDLGRHSRIKMFLKAQHLLDPLKYIYHKLFKS